MADALVDRGVHRQLETPWSHNGPHRGSTHTQQSSSSSTSNSRSGDSDRTMSAIVADHHPLATPPKRSPSPGSGTATTKAQRPRVDTSSSSVLTSSRSGQDPFGSPRDILSNGQEADLGALRSPSSEDQEYLDNDAGTSFKRRANNYSGASEISQSVYENDGPNGPAASTDRLTPVAGEARGRTSGYGGTGSGTSALSRFTSLRRTQKAPSSPPQPMTPEEEDSQLVQRNLERWAAEERQRRKALRSSRSGSQILSQGQSSSLGRKMSTTQGRNGPSNSLLRSSLGTESFSSLESMPDGGRSSGSPYTGINGAQGMGNVSPPSSLSTIDSPRDSKGKARAVDNPFHDPSDGHTGSSSSRSALDSPYKRPAHTREESYNKPRPTAKNPIVTVGGAPKIRQHLGPSIGPNGRALPSIVSTDADAALEFAGGKYEMARGGATYGRQTKKPVTIDEDREEEDRESEELGDDAASAKRRNGKQKQERRIGDLAPPSRKSTNDSRFNEVDLDISDDGSDSGPHTPMEGDEDGSGRAHSGMQARSRFTSVQMGSRPAGAHEEGRRVAWWTEWLCCCAGPPPDDEQTGRTNPLE